ncbi:MAG: helix-turn-helix domain-containing protein [Gammaproteobacteria bacterium]
MNVPINVQILKDAEGKPAFAVIPYSDYLRLPQRREPTVPNDVVGKVVNEGMTPVRAWREHLGLTQADVAQRLDISQSAYAQQEAKESIRKSTREKIARALGIEPEQLVI